MTQYTNALINEPSPYLQQHAHNPVHWYPWGEAAFAKAKKEDKPIFLSIGYSTCHWCHVMEHESFEDEEVAKAMNDTFIAIKVDREERPDIDQVYMQVAQMMNGQGGWPLNILMTPDKKPFYAATYIPKYTRYQRIGMLDLTSRTKALWASKRSEMEDSAEKITELLTSRSGVSDTSVDLDAKALAAKAISNLKSSFDQQHGGFGGAPKFPSPHKLLFLLREAKKTGDKESIAMVEQTLDAMRAGGLFDQIGFGFHRYSTDAQWLLPHFEKMLYDQAMLMMAYTECYQLTKHQRHADVVREIATYLLRDMRDKTGGFYSAEDADSEGVEGKFYVWNNQEIESILGKNDAKIAKKYFNLEENGNFHDEATGEKTGENIPHLSAWQGKAHAADIQGIRKKLFDAREKRVHPFRDDKILTDWNGLMVAAFAKAARVLHEPVYLEAAQKSADFLLHTMRKKDGALLHRYRQGDAAIDAHLDDYAFVVWGLIELYQANYDARYLQAALDLNVIMLKDFKAEHGGLYMAAHTDELLIRPLDAWDGALPSGNAVAAENMIRLARLTGNTKLEEEAAHIFAAFSQSITQVPDGFMYMLSALALAEGDGMEVVFAGDMQSEQAQTMLNTFNGVYLPHAVSLWRDKHTQAMIPFIALQTPVNQKVTVYVCNHFQCNQPVTSVEALRALIQ